MIGKQFLYFFQKALQNLRHFFLINLITIVIISLSLLVLSTFLMTFLNLQAFIDKWKSQIHVTAYLMQDIAPEELRSVRERITAFPEVKRITFLSKEEALTYFERAFPDQKNVFQGLAENPLPASFDIELKEAYQGLEQIKTVARKVKPIPGVDQVEYGGVWIEGYLNVLSVIKSTTIAVGAVIALATIFIISNTIRLTVYARKEEIEIMRLVGATNAFIKIPFFIEGAILGLAGSAIALATVYVGYHLLTQWITQVSYLPLKTLHIAYLPPRYLSLMTGGGILTGLVGTSFALRRHLKT